MLIGYFAKGSPREDVVSLLPYKIEVNARVVYSSDLIKDPVEALLIRELLEGYFTRGIKLNDKQLGVKTCEAIEALLFGYHTFRRFQDFLKKEYGEFLNQVHRYQGKSLLELITPFKREGKSREELELELRKAVFEENYERAALIKRELQALEGSEKPKSSS